MSVVDTPPGLGLPGVQVGWFAARPGPRRRALRGFAFCLAVGSAAIWISAKRLGRGEVDAFGTRLVVVVTAVLVCGVALAVRRARVGIASDGVRWGWGELTVRMAAERVVRVRLYRDAIALEPRRGSTWFLSRRDWDRFEIMRRTALASGLPCEELEGAAPWRARLQSYGGFVDGLVVVGSIAVTIVAALAAL